MKAYYLVYAAAVPVAVNAFINVMWRFYPDAIADFTVFALLVIVAGLMHTVDDCKAEIQELQEHLNNRHQRDNDKQSSLLL